MEGIHAKYSKRMETVLWDPIHIEYPLRKFPGTGESSKTICHQWNQPPEVLTRPRIMTASEKEYSRNHACLADMNRSEYTMQSGYKQRELVRFNKHTESSENQYLYPPTRMLEQRPPMPFVHGTTEMKSSYKVPALAARLTTDKEQFRHPLTMTTANTFTEPSWSPNLEALDTTHEGFEKYLDPYLTTSRLHHRPFTADQLSRPSNAKDIVTYYTFSSEPWVRSRKPGAGNWWLPIKMPKSMYDREKFKQDRREVIVHNKPGWIQPGSFRTEIQDNFINPKTRPQSSIHNKEEDTQFYYKRCLAKLATIDPIEDLALKALYDTESRHVGTGRPVCSAVEQHIEKNIRLQKCSSRRT